MDRHQAQEPHLGVPALGRAQSVELGVGRHPGHQRAVGRADGVAHPLHGRPLRTLRPVPRLQPAQHHAPLVGLGVDDVVREPAHVLVVGAVPHQERHLHRLLVVDRHVPGEPHVGRALRGDGDGGPGAGRGRRRGPYDHQQHQSHGHQEHHGSRRHQRPGGARRGHPAIPPLHAAPGSGVCGPCTYLVKNWATRASVALFTVTCLPQALSISGSF